MPRQAQQQDQQQEHRATPLQGRALVSEFSRVVAATIQTLFMQPHQEMQQQQQQQQQQEQQPHESTTAPPTNHSLCSCWKDFASMHPPNIALARYVERLATYAGCTLECFVVALVYLKRVEGSVGSGRFPITEQCIHRLLLTLLVIAAKLRDDRYYTMTYYAQVGGVTNAELRKLEVLAFDRILRFDATVQPDEYEAMTATMLKCGSYGSAHEVASILGDSFHWRMAV